MEDIDNKIYEPNEKKVLRENKREQKLFQQVNKIALEKGYHFSNYKQLFNQDFLPVLVMHVLRISSINDAVPLQTPIKQTNDNMIQIINNANAVVKLLKRLSPEFEILVFDFSSPLKQEISVKLLLKSLFKYFDPQNPPESISQPQESSTIEPPEINQQFKMTNEPYLFWNYSTSYIGLNKGILYEKSHRLDSNIHWKLEIQSIPKIQQQNHQTTSDFRYSNKKEIFSELYKLFIYDEKHHEWKFDQTNFDRFARDKNINEKVILSLFMDSNENDVIRINECMNNTSYQNLNISSYDKIFVYALSSMFDDDTKYVMLIVHVPQRFQNHPNIRSILIQIYSILSIICNYKITILDKYCINYQGITINLINSIIFNDERNLPSTILLFNEDGIEYTDEIDQFINNDNINGNNIFAYLKSNFYKNQYYIHHININEFKSYKYFLSSLSKNRNYLSYTIILDYFKKINTNRISDLYIDIKNQLDSWKVELRKNIDRRYFILESDINYVGNSFTLLSMIMNELLIYSPSFDTEFKKEAFSIIAEMQAKASHEEREILTLELKESSESHLSHIEEQLIGRYFLKEKELNIIEEGHYSFLKNEFFQIIQKVSNSNTYQLIYSNNIDILNEQVRNDKNKFIHLFEHFRENIRKSESIEERNIRDDAVNSANYVMKESEVIKEAEIIVDINGDLKNEIEQDF